MDTPRLTAQGTVRDMKMAEVSGRIGAWSRGRIGAWAKGQEINASTVPGGVNNTFGENLPPGKTSVSPKPRASRPTSVRASRWR